MNARLVLLALSITLAAAAEPGAFTGWPTGTAPEEIGRRVAERFVSSPHLNHPTIVYPEVCAWYGALTFADVTGNRDLAARLVQRFDKLLTPAEAALIPTERHVDFSVFGTVPLEIYIQTKARKYLDLGLKFADRQWQTPAPGGLTSETRFWIDDMYMITAVQVQAFRATGETKYLDRAALEMAAYLDKLQQPNGLFYHAPDVPFYWGRGNGWVAAGMTELLRSLPPDHPRRARILASYRRMMESLLRYQGGDGVWRQLIDRSESWPETSSTGMFAFAMINGVKEGWLDEETYAPAARKAWLGLVGYLDEHGDVRNVCEGTSKKNDLQYYLDRRRLTGDLHGQAPILWSATALLRPSDARALEGIAHVAFRVSDVGAARAFYEKLGFLQAFEFSDARGTATSYLQINDRQYIELYRRQADEDKVGLMHLCFDTGAIGRLREAYLQRGLQPAPIAKARAGNLLFTLRDPEGQLLEYTQYLPGSLHWNAGGKHNGGRRISIHLAGAAMPVKDLAAAHAFYTNVLGFENPSGARARLRTPGSSGETLELQDAAPGWKPRLEFIVEDVAATTEELRSRGLAVEVTGHAAVVHDPDGAVLEFARRN